MTRPLNPCRRCGRTPRDVSSAFHYMRDGNRYEMWVECRRWFGLVLCQKTESAWNFKHWADLAYHRSVNRWNEQNPVAL